jgi:hypothetical protein
MQEAPQTRDLLIARLKNRALKDDRRAFAETLFKLALVIRQIGTGDGSSMPAAVTRLCGVAKGIYLELGDLPAAAACLRLSVFFQGREEATAILDEAEALSLRAGDRSGVAAVLCRRAVRACDENAVKYYDRAEAIYREEDDEKGLGELLLARSIHSEGEERLRHLREGERLLTESGDLGNAGKCAMQSACFDCPSTESESIAALMRATALFALSQQGDTETTCRRLVRKRLWRNDRPLASLFGALPFDRMAAFNSGSAWARESRQPQTAVFLTWAVGELRPSQSK